MAITDLELSVGLVPGDVKKTAKDFGDAIKDIFDSTAGEKLNLQLNSLKKILSDDLSSVTNLYDAIEKLEGQEIPTDAYKEIKDQIDKDTVALAKLSEKIEDFREKGGDTKSDTFMRMTVQADELRESITYAKSELEELVKEGKAFTLGSETEQYDKLIQRLGDRLNTTRLHMEKWNEQSGGGISSIGQFSTSLQQSLSPLINFNKGISSIAGTLSSAFGPYIEIAKMAIQALIAVMKTAMKVFSEFVKLVGKTTYSVFKPLVGILKTTGTAIKSLFTNIQKHSATTLKNLLGTMILSGIIVKSLTYLIGQLRSMSSGLIDELAKQIPEVNKEMSAFQTALNGLKGSLASAFQPILTTILPILTKLINAVSRAIAVVAKFIALLTGQQYVYEATATQVDYAASLDKTGKSAKKAAKELKGYLSPLDEINKFQSNKDSDSGGGGGAGGDFTMKKVPIDDWMKDFWDKIKQSWEHADFFWLGKMLGDKLAKALAQIPWAEIRAKARQLGRSLATLLNGFMYGEFNGKSLATYIGQTIAGAINTAFDFVDSYISEFDFDKFGKSIMEALAGIFDNLDWNLITGTLARLGTGIGDTLAAIFNDLATWAKAGEALARGINSLIYGIFNIFNEIEGSVVGAAISRFLNKFIEWIDTGAATSTFNEIIRDILDALIVAVETTHWDELGEKIAGMINGIDFKGIFGRYTTLANSIIDAIFDMLESFLDTLTPEKVEEIGNSIADTINGLDFQPERFGQLANRLLQSLLDIALDTVDKIDWEKIGQDIVTFLEQIDWSSLIQKATELIQGLKDGFSDIFSQVWDWLKPFLWEHAGELWDLFRELTFGMGTAIVGGLISGILSLSPVGQVLNIFNLVIQGIKKLFGIASPSKVLMDIGNNIVLGFINGIKTIVDKTKKVWEDLKKTTVSIFEGIWNGIKKVINSILGGVEKMANGIIDGLNKAIGAMNNLQFDVPGWVPIVGGNHLGFNIPTLNNITIPRLAQGAVIPPNKEFLAMLGDQKSGTNIETPLSTMVDAFNQAFKQNGGGKTEITFVTPDRRTLAKYVIEGGKVLQTSTGRNPFELA